MATFGPSPSRAGSSRGLPPLEASARLSRYHLAPTPASLGPGLLIYAIGKFLRVVAVYAAHAYLTRHSGSVVYFVAASIVGAAGLFNALQRPWRGRQMPREQLAPVVLAGAVLVLSQLLWAYGLKNSGPIRSTFGEYAGVALAAAASALGLGARSSGTAGRGRKLAGVLAVLAALYLLSQSSGRVGGPAGTALGDARMPLSLRRAVQLMLAPMAVGLLAMVRKALERYRASKAFPKRRMHAMSVGVAAVMMLPVCLVHALATHLGLWGQPPLPLPPLLAATNAVGALSWLLPMSSAVLQVVLFAWGAFFYVEGFAEERLGTTAASLQHVAVSAGAVCMLQELYTRQLLLSPLLPQVGLLAAGVRLCTAQTVAVLDEGLPRSRTDGGPGSMGALGRGSGSPPLSWRAAGAAAAGWARALVECAAADRRSRRIALFLGLSLTFMGVEMVVGALANSLGLLSDALHMSADCAALAVGLAAAAAARLPASESYPYGYGRVEVLAGFANAVLLLFTAATIVLESIERLAHPPAVTAAGPLLPVAASGLLVNLLGLVVLHGAQHAPQATDGAGLKIVEGAHAGCDHGSGAGGRCSDPKTVGSSHGHNHSHHHGSVGHSHGGHDHSMRGLWLHVIADTLGSAGVIVSTLLIRAYGWRIADPLCSLLIAGLVAAAALSLLRSSGELLLQATPRELLPGLRTAADQIRAIPGVRAVTRLQPWAQTPAEVFVALAVTVAPAADAGRVLREATAALRTAAGPGAAITVQVEQHDGLF